MIWYTPRSFFKYYRYEDLGACHNDRSLTVSRQSLYCPYGLKVWLTHMAGTNALLKHCYQHASTDPLIEAIFHKVVKLMVV